MAMSQSPDPQKAKQEAEIKAKQDEEAKARSANVRAKSRSRGLPQPHQVGQEGSSRENIPGVLGLDLPKVGKTLPPVGQPARLSKSMGSSPEQEIKGYGKQLQLERELRGWTQEQLAARIGVDVSVVQLWETNRSSPDRTYRQKLAELLGNYYSLSSEVLTNGDLQVCVVQIELTAHDFTTIISALTEFYTQFWLLQQGRIDDLAKYTKSQDSRFVREANLVIDNLASNSPALITLITDPGTATSAVTSSVTLAVAMQKAVDAIVQVWVKIINAKIDARNKGALQRKKEEEERRKLIKEALHDIATIIDEVYPGVDQQTRTMLVQAILPKYLDFIEKGVKFDLPLL
jgi:transcriptional regulator with XRE-family HTH domain